MNFISHYLAVMGRIAADDRLRATHVSLYVALFTVWNRHKFVVPLSINRRELMGMSKIGSQHTYYGCMRALHAYGYLRYCPSTNAFTGSVVHMCAFDAEGGNSGGGGCAEVEGGLSKKGGAAGAVLQPSIKQKTLLNSKGGTPSKRGVFKIPERASVEAFFVSAGSSSQEGQRFFYYYASVDWKVGRKKMKDWQAAARHWMLRSRGEHVQLKNRDKDYGTPL